jgi:hypothetical protein
MDLPMTDRISHFPNKPIKPESVGLEMEGDLLQQAERGHKTFRKDYPGPVTQWHGRTLGVKLEPARVSLLGQLANVQRFKAVAKTSTTQYCQEFIAQKI